MKYSYSSNGGPEESEGGKGEPATAPAALGPAPRLAAVMEAIRSGRMVVLVQDAAERLEGFVCFAAESTLASQVNFVATHARGLVCLALDEERTRKLELPLMVPDSGNGSTLGMRFTVSIEARLGVTTGISAHDRAHTILTAVDPEAKPKDLGRPGHVFPLLAREGGLLTSPGRAEAAVDLMRLAGMRSAAVLCSILDEDGAPAGLEALHAFARRHGLPTVFISDLQGHRLRSEPLVYRAGEARLATRHGEFRALAFVERDGTDHIALTSGDPGGELTPVAIHFECFAGDVFGARCCDCAGNLVSQLEAISGEGCGVIVYLRRQETRLVHLFAGASARETQAAGSRLPHHGSPRDYGVIASILRDLGVRRLRLLAPDTRALEALGASGLLVDEDFVLGRPFTNSPARQGRSPTSPNSRASATSS